MNLKYLIDNPEEMDRETLYNLRTLVALYPYYQTARLLMLQNLYILHDPTFDEELRRAAVYITDRKTLFKMIEAVHYRLTPPEQNRSSESSADSKNADTKQGTDNNRTTKLIDTFLESIPKEEKEAENPKRKPTPADAAIDYVAYLLEIENEEERNGDSLPKMKGQSLIDDFIQRDGGKITLNEDTPPESELPHSDNDENNTENGIFTETLAQIYIKQGKYDKALEIIKRLNLIYPKKNRYFADQIRFLEKLIINNNK